MNKLTKVIVFFIILISLVQILFPVYAAETVIDHISKPVIGEKAEDIGRNALGIIATIGMVVAVTMAIVLGIKYMTVAANEKADIKKSLIPYVVGAAILFGASGIVSFLANTITSLK